MASLSKLEWEAARKTWSEDIRPGYGWLAEGLGVSRQAVSKTATKQAWQKVALVAHESTSPQSEQPTTPVQNAMGKDTSLTAPAVPCLAAGDWTLMTRRQRGRPTDYRDEFVDEIISYFDITVESVIDVDVVDRNGKAVTEKKVVINTFPTLTRFASSIGITRETLHDWATAKNPDGTLRRPEFSYAYARAKDMQDALLVEGGLSGSYEGRFAVFAAKNLIGWKDQIETTAEFSVTGPTIEQLDQLYREGMEAVARNRAVVIEREKSMALATAVAAK